VGPRSTTSSTPTAISSVPDSPPSRADVERTLLGLIDGTISREDASAWAARWVGADDPGISDAAVWEQLRNLGGADLISFDRPFLYNEVDFRAWLAELRSAG
jgi:hypothetical protein